jgi:hypothetical protein
MSQFANDAAASLETCVTETPNFSLPRADRTEPARNCGWLAAVGRSLFLACLVVGSAGLFTTAVAAWVKSAEASQAPVGSLPGQQEQRLAAERRVKSTATARAHLRTLGQELAAGRRTLAASVTELENSDAVRDAGLLATFARCLPGRAAAECLAATLMESALRATPDPLVAEELKARLQAEFASTYGTSAPSFCWKTLDTRAAF